ncbi:MAG TPA: hypothetical protein PLP63_06510 [Saprospiraceae bacterium]|nr:hypothetical protein [Saprospiraceae bacterium]
MEEQEILTRSDITSRFKNADIITRDYETGVFYHQIRLPNGYLAIHENMPKEKKFFGRAWFKNNSIYEISLNSKEELLEMIDDHVNPLTFTKKAKRKVKSFFKTIIQKLWNLINHKKQ